MGRHRRRVSRWERIEEDAIVLGAVAVLAGVLVLIGRRRGHRRRVRDIAGHR